MGAFVNAYAERRYKEVMEETWGHLSFEKGEYDQTMVFVVSDGGCDKVLVARAGLPNSPWEHEFIGALFHICGDNYSGYKSSKCYIKYEDQVESDGVYKFTGKITVDKKNSVSRVRGTVKKIFTWEVSDE